MTFENGFASDEGCKVVLVVDFAECRDHAVEGGCALAFSSDEVDELHIRVRAIGVEGGSW